MAETASKKHIEIVCFRHRQFECGPREKYRSHAFKMSAPWRTCRLRQVSSSLEGT